MTRGPAPAHTVPGLEREAAGRLIGVPRLRPHALNGPRLAREHVHGSVVGPYFAAVHAMIGPRAGRVRERADDVAERIAAPGGMAPGTPGAGRGAALGRLLHGRADAVAHRGALDLVYTGVVRGVRDAVKDAGRDRPGAGGPAGRAARALERVARRDAKVA
ncbi:hypothetical protein [Streptomyces sp. NRRL F-5065]|uniref:hypothetical protein n=1 Tax=Streptomyces sp. NRRL F-5065 TaxID=1463855 RepID=UPI000690695B|nr:hypothetical protein [Streptomyces sp. NRRL F-5065]